MVARVTLPLLLLGAPAATVARCTGNPAACPVWPAAVHIEGSYNEITCVSVNGGEPNCIVGNGTVAWDTLGDANKPFKSLSHEKRVYTITTPGAGPAPESTSEFWQLCPSHENYRNSSVSIAPGTPPITINCQEILAPCLHRYDPVSMALAACSSWGKTDSGNRQIRYHGEKCNFGIIPVPGVTSVGTFDFDVGASGAHDIKQWMTTTIQTIKSGGSVTVQNVTETVVVSHLTQTPDEAVFRGHCAP